MLPALDADSLLALWERALGQPAGSRDDVLLRAMAQSAEPPRALSERNARFIEIHASLFGRDLALVSHCPACGAIAEFTGDCAVLTRRLAEEMSTPEEGSSHHLESHGHLVEFRLPDAADVKAASTEDADDDFVWRLLDRCVVKCTRDGADVSVRELPGLVLEALSGRMEMLAPGASVSFAVTCPHCDARWNAPLDAAQLVWQKVQAAAERLLFEIDALARAYGWTELDVLRLSPLRRAAYLQMVTS
jgi:hypothetical protein